MNRDYISSVKISVYEICFTLIISHAHLFINNINIYYYYY